MSYLVLARKCRPKLFYEVVGQQHITKTLKNSILSGRIAHSFLFTGPRGVGKTTTARILAKSLNCKNVRQGEPCNTCTVCQGIAEGSFVDVLEIDGASNNSVDDIRDLREKVRYVPTVGRNKIYIIDEVHMLSTAAFNALLKTLEEPPDHAIFIFATTEPHKIPATILSRCQRFDFRRLRPKEIADALQSIVEAEGWEIPKPVLTLIARAADGSMRDAQSIMDQVISCSEGDIKYDEVLYLLGQVKKDQIYSIWEAIFNRQPEAILSGMAQVLERGYELRYVAEQLLHYLRDLIVYKTCPNPDSILDMSEEELDPLKRQSDLASLEDLQQYFHILAQCLDQMRGASHPQIILEMTLVRLAKMEDVASFGEILQRLAELEGAIREGEILLAGDLPDYSRSPRSACARSACVRSASPRSACADSLPTTLPNDTPPPAAEPEEASSLAAEESPSDTTVDAPSYTTVDAPSHAAEEAPSPVTLDAPSNAPSLMVSECSAGSSLSQEQKWAIVRETVKKKKKSLAPILKYASLDSITDRVITLSFPKNPPFYLDTITQESNRTLLQEWCQNIFGADYRLDCCARKTPGADQDPASGQEDDCMRSGQEGCTHREIDAIMPQYPIIRSAVEIFSAELTQSRVFFRHKG